MVYAVKTRKTLQNNSNILLSSLAVADLLVGFYLISLIDRSRCVPSPEEDQLVSLPYSTCKSNGAVHFCLLFFVPFDCDCMGKVCGDKKMEGL